MYTLHNISNNFGMKISPETSGTMAFLGQNPGRCKIVVDKKMFTSKKF